MIELYFQIQLFGYSISLDWDEYNGRNENGKYIPIWKPYIFGNKETEKQAAKYYGHWWAWSWNWLYFEFEITKLA